MEAKGKKRKGSMKKESEKNDEGRELGKAGIGKNKGAQKSKPSLKEN